MTKIINLKPEEEITSVIEQLWETGEEEVILVALKESVLLKNIIVLKLLKREADRLGKEILIVAKDEVVREAAKRVGLSARASLPKDKKSGGGDEILREVPFNKFEALLEEEVAEKRRSPSGHFGMSDIRPKGRLGGRVLSEDGNGFAFSGDDFEKSVVEEKIASLPSEAEDEWCAEEKTEEDIFSAEPEEKIIAEDENGDELSAGEDIFLPEENGSFFQRDARDGRRKAHGRNWLGIFFGLLKKRQSAPVAQKVVVRNEDDGGDWEIAGGKAAAPFFSGRFLFVFVLTVLAVAAAVLYFVLPKTEIEIIPKTESFSRSLNVVVDRGISKVDYEQNKIPAQLIKLEKKDSREFAATGQRQVNEKAKGVITVFNEYSSSPQSLVAKTRFESEGGKVFRTTKTVVIPGAKIIDGRIVASSIEVEVAADQSGGEHNIAGGRFSIPGFAGTPKFDAFYGRSDKGFGGGAAGLLKVISQDDLDKAKTQLWNDLRLSLDRDLRAQIPAGLKILDSASKIDLAAVESSKEVGQPSDKFVLTIKGLANVLLFNEKDIAKIAEKKIKDGLGLSGDVEVKTEKIDYLTSGTLDFFHGQMNLGASLSGQVIWSVDSDEIKKSVAGKNEQAMRDYFSRRVEVVEVKVSFWPFWVKAASVNLDKIKIIINGQTEQH